MVKWLPKLPPHWKHHHILQTDTVLQLVVHEHGCPVQEGITDTSGVAALIAFLHIVV